MYVGTSVIEKHMHTYVCMCAYVANTWLKLYNDAKLQQIVENSSEMSISQAIPRFIFTFLALQNKHGYMQIHRCIYIYTTYTLRIYIWIRMSVFTHANEDGAGDTETLEALLASHIHISGSQVGVRRQEPVVRQSVYGRAKSHYIHNNSYENV